MKPRYIPPDITDAYIKAKRKKAGVSKNVDSGFLLRKFNFIRAFCNYRSRAPPSFFLPQIRRKEEHTVKVIYKFADGVTSEVEVAGELAAEYCVMAGVDPNVPPETLKMSDIEKRADRKHKRPHKYTGLPVSLDEAAEEAVGGVDDYAEIESEMVTDEALSTLTDLQRFCFVEVCLNGRTQDDVAGELGKSRRTIRDAIEAARKNLKKYFL